MRHDPPFRAEHIGSLLRPPELLAARQSFDAQQLSAEALREVDLCRGNNQGKWLGEGGYDFVAERIFTGLDLDVFFLEYDSPRAGSFEPLRHVPRDRRVVLGLVSSKTAALEPPADLAKRIDEASRFVPLDRLGLSPQCGFASTAPGNPLTPADQEAKLRLVVETARAVWR